MFSNTCRCFLMINRMGLLWVWYARANDRGSGTIMKRTVLIMSLPNNKSRPLRNTPDFTRSRFESPSRSSGTPEATASAVAFFYPQWRGLEASEKEEDD